MLEVLIKFHPVGSESNVEEFGDELKSPLDIETLSKLVLLSALATPKLGNKKANAIIKIHNVIIKFLVLFIFHLVYRF